MPWGRLDDGLYDHPKLDALGRSRLPAVGLWILAISWSNRRLSNGFVPMSLIPKLGGSRAIAESLVIAGMFDRADGGYLIHDFLVFNESREQVEARRESDRKRKRKPDGLQPEASRSPNDPPARAGSRPVPSRPITPKSPPSGDHGKPRENGVNPRALGTSPRQVADAASAEADERAEGRRWRHQERDLAYRRGEITEGQLADMDRDDTPLEQIEGWAEHRALLAADTL